MNDTDLMSGSDARREEDVERAITAPGGANGETEHKQAKARRGAASTVLLVVLVAGQFMAVLDASIVNVAAPVMRSDLHASGAGLQWIIAGYTIAYAMLLITGSRLGAIFGYGRAYLGGLGLFTLASLACGLASSTGELVVFRCLQGAGAALLVPQVLTLIQRRFEGRRRTAAMGLYQTAIAGGAVVGQILGGVLVSADLFGTGWRPVFLVNVPLGVLLLVVGWRALGGDGPDPGGRPGWGRLDVPGVLVLAPAMLALVVPLVMGHEQGWPVWGWVLLAAGVAGMGLFAVVERAVAARGGSPLVPGAVLRSPGLLSGGIALLIAVASYNGFLFTLALHLQSGLGDSPLRAGLTYVPCAIGFAVSGLWWGRLPERIRAHVGYLGFALVSVSYVGMAASVHGGREGGVALAVGLAAMGLGQGAVIGPLMASALGRVRAEHAGDASGVLVTLMQVGAVLGVATYGTTFLSATGVGAGASAHAAVVTFAALAVVNVCAAVWAWRVAAGRRAGRVA
ncbi:MFS transporter [Embleya scabrispora]|uniref:MFS transporter n=1 Tax=Embleya scabrispora TaxID=159449 RepID=UPI00037A4F7C|nr:MFS transporter [Embleya scabrispora]MYS84636.1 MFS transporter [Streptomyces sp. SID5474]